LREIERRDIGSPFFSGDPRMDRYTLADYYRWKLRGDIVLVAEEDGKIMGVVDVVKKGDYLLIDMIAVNKPFQGRGVGSMLLKKVEEISTSMRKKGVILEALDSAVNFYLKRGFSVESRRIDKRFGVLTLMKKDVPLEIVKLA